MKICEELKSNGWFLKEEFIEKYSKSNEVLSAALNMDLREIGSGVLSTKREDTLPCRIVLQIMKIRNIAAPKAKEDSKQAPRLLLIDLTDGHTTIQALDLEFVPALDLKTVPGTKIFFRSERLRLMQGFIVLHSGEFEVLGGKVPSLVEKWEFAQSMKQCTLMGRRSNCATGPPLWIAFDKKKVYDSEIMSSEKNFRSIKTTVPKEEKVNEGFVTMRSEAIDQANKIGIKKIFGGGNQKILDYNVKNITAKGFSEQEAKEALRVTNNNLERTLYYLKRGQIDNTIEKQRKGFTKNNNKQIMDDMVSAPSSNATVTLYDFLKCETANKPDLQSLEQPRPNVVPSHKYSEQRNDKFVLKNHQMKSRVYSQRQNNVYDSKISGSIKNAEPQKTNDSIVTQQYGKGMQKPCEKNNENNPSFNKTHNPISTQSSTKFRNQRASNEFYDSSKVIGFKNKTAAITEHHIQTNLSNNLNQRTSTDSIRKRSDVNSTYQKLNAGNTLQGPKTKNNAEWEWKIGDFCIAKYWDDGQYYNAQITAISENTCVVLFLNYGNYEEVLKNDCLPVGDKTFNSDKRTNNTRRFRKSRQKDDN